MTSEGPAGGNPSLIPTPPDFPVKWQHPGDEALFWQADRMHFPEPATPLLEGFIAAFNTGFERAAIASEVPVKMQYRRFNTYFYAAVAPRVPLEEMEAQGQKAQQAVGANMGRFQEWWDGELLPEVMEHMAFWESFDLAGASMPALLSHLDDTQKRLTRLWDIHFLVAFPFLVAPSVFSDFHGEVLGQGGALEAFRLLQGFGNKTVEGDHALWALSRKARASSDVRRAVEENEPADVPGALEGSAEGRAFLEELGAYLEEYGQRSDVFAEFGYPHWIENPATPIKSLKDYVAEGDRDPPAELAELAQERERLRGEARARLKEHPEPVQEQFEFLLKAAQAGTIIQEDHNHWIDQRATYKVRRVLLEFGRRCAEAGVIEVPNDVFYLTPDELRETASSLPRGDRREIVVERKAEMDRFRAIGAPLAIGTAPAGPPPDDPLTRAFGRFWGDPPQEEATEGSRVVKGNPASPGKVTATAKVVPSLAEAGKLQPGDVLVAPATMPAWTPLFASIAAVVTDAGGVLSHAAIVAREYNIPAVLGTVNATTVIKDGQTVEVNGDEGVVRIVS